MKLISRSFRIILICTLTKNIQTLFLYYRFHLLGTQFFKGVFKQRNLSVPVVLLNGRYRASDCKIRFPISEGVSLEPDAPYNCWSQIKDAGFLSCVRLSLRIAVL